GQVLSIANSKFAIGPVDNQIDDLPIHQINAVGTASVSDSVLTTNFGIQFECIISDYIGKDKPIEILFHPNESCLKNITSNPLIVTENSMEISEETSEEIQKQEEQEESAASILTPATTPATTTATTSPSQKSGGHAKKV
ncbi:hypothetical protein RhiirC2_744087, partial [Rhizophagus irregularis]